MKEIVNSYPPLHPLAFFFFFVLAPLFARSLISRRSPRGKEETTRSLEVEVISGGYLSSRAPRLGKYLTLVTDTEGDNCFSICPVSE